MLRCQCPSVCPGLSFRGTHPIFSGQKQKFSNGTDEHFLDWNSNLISNFKYALVVMPTSVVASFNRVRHMAPTAKEWRRHVGTLPIISVSDVHFITMAASIAVNVKQPFGRLYVWPSAYLSVCLSVSPIFKSYCDLIN